MPDPQRPRPAADGLTRPFWEAARRGQLVVQRCESCATWQHPPSTGCHRCGGGLLAFQAVSGAARLFSWSILHQGLAPGFDACVPYLNLLVELVEQPGLLMLSDQRFDPAVDAALKIGAPMQVWFEAVDADFTLPQFRFAAAMEAAAA